MSTESQEPTNETIVNLKTEIDELKTSINDPDIPAETKTQLEEALGIAEADLVTEENKEKALMEAEAEKLKQKAENKNAKKEEKKLAKVENQKGKPKSEVKFGDKSVKDATVDELNASWEIRKAEIISSEGKTKTKSPISRATPENIPA